jgi:hypothetical protein
MAGEYEKHGLGVSLHDWFEENRDAVPLYMKRYFYGVGDDPKPYGGRHFEAFIEMSDPDRFGPVDFLAIQALEVSVPSGSTLQVLGAAADKCKALLNDLPRGPIWKAKRSVFEPGGAAIELYRLLDDLPGVGATKATKLMAAKRPHLIPIQDAFVEEELILPRGRFWLPMYDQLADASLRDLIGEVTKAAPENISLLRRVDVAVWMHVSDRKKAERARQKGPSTGRPPFRR